MRTLSRGSSCRTCGIGIRMQNSKLRNSSSVRIQVPAASGASTIPSNQKSDKVLPDRRTALSLLLRLLFKSGAFMRLGWIICFAIVISQILSAQSEPGKKATEDSNLLGYSSQGSQQQKDWEKKFRDGIVPDNIRENMRR